MNEPKKRLVKILAIVIPVVVILIVAAFLITQYIQQEQWITRTIDTETMADTRRLVKNNRLTVRSLLPDRVTKENVTLYSARLYPEASTAICTVKKPKQYEQFTAYLVSKDGTVYPGWYNPQSMGDISTDRHGVVKFIFEKLDTTQIVKFNLVDKSKIVGEYDPNTFTDHISFDLTPPPREFAAPSSVDEGEGETISSESPENG